MKHKIFVGSSTETRNLAESVRAHLLDIADVTVWDQDVFKLGRGTLATLLGEAIKYDFAVFILGPDDGIQYRDEDAKTPRGNVLFELGLFMGVLGGDRVFGMFSDQRDLKIPSDFAGVTIAMYESADLDLNDSASRKQATKGACDKIRVAIDEALPPARSDILTHKTVRSISTYLLSRQEDDRFAVLADPTAALAQFDADCHAAMKTFPIHDSIKDALGTPFGLYVQAIGAVTETEPRYLNCCVRPGPEPGGNTYLEAILEDDRPREGFIAENVAEEIKKKAFGHWLLSQAFAPVPLAVVIDCSVKPAWDADISVVYKTPLVFAIDASGTSEDFERALQEFRDKKVSFAGLKDRFESLKRMLSDHKENYMGRIIKSVLFIPVHGWPGLTLQILTREKLLIDTKTPEDSRKSSREEDSRIRLTIDELMAVRLCGQRLQGLLARRLQRMPKDVGAP